MDLHYRIPLDISLNYQKNHSLFPKLRIDFCSGFAALLAVFCLKLANFALILFGATPEPVFVFISGLAIVSNTDEKDPFADVALPESDLVGGVF